MGWRRGQSYGQDLRERVLAAVGEPIRAVAARFAVSPSYVSKVQSRMRRRDDCRAAAQSCAAAAGADLYGAAWTCGRAGGCNHCRTADLGGARARDCS
jgi:hypothetical protein